MIGKKINTETEKQARESIETINQFIKKAERIADL